MKNSTKVNIFQNVACGIIGGLIGFLPYASVCDNKLIPLNEKVQREFIAPSKLEITVEDKDRNGEKETYMRVGKESYLLKYDKEGKPVLQRYTIEPAEIVPKE